MYQITIIYEPKDESNFLQKNRQLTVQTVYLAVYICQIDSSCLNYYTCLKHFDLEISEWNLRYVEVVQVATS
jgi:hypothetical protein